MRTRLLLLHGAPASGKLTTARALLDRVTGRLLDNHSSIDYARTLFDFGEPGFWELVEDARNLVIARACESAVPLVVCTLCYGHPSDLPHLEKIEAILAKHHGELLPVYLSCPMDVLKQRAGAPDRVARNKLTSPDQLELSVRRWNVSPIPRANCFTVETNQHAPAESARLIVEHFGLDTEPT